MQGQFVVYIDATGRARRADVGSPEERDLRSVPDYIVGYYNRGTNVEQIREDAECTRRLLGLKIRPGAIFA